MENKESQKDVIARPKTERKGRKKSCLVVFVVILILAVAGIVLLNVINSAIENNIARQKAEDAAIADAAKTTPSVAPTPTADLLDYFYTIAFNANDAATAQNVAVDELSRWNKPNVSIELLDDYTQPSTDALNAFIAQFNAVSNTKLGLVSSGGDIKISFQSREALAKLQSEQVRRNKPVYAWTNIQGGCSISSSKIYLQSDMQSQPNLLTFTLGHELLHALGFKGHDPTPRGCNYMTDVACGPKTAFSDYDTFAIKALYNVGLTACKSKATTSSYLNAHLPE